MSTVSLQWVYRLGFLLTAANANVVSTHGAHTEVEVTSSGEVVRSNTNQAKPLSKVADGIMKAMSSGFDTVSGPSAVQYDSYLQGDAPSEVTIDPFAYKEPDPFTTILKNEGNGTFYTVNLCFGKLKRNLDVKEMCMPGIPDTGSFELVVRSTRCKKCRQPMYNESQSDGFEEHNKVSKKNKTTLLYGSGPVDAIWMSDDVRVQHENEFLSTFGWNSLAGTGNVVSVEQQRFLAMASSPIADLGQSKNFAGIYGIGRGEKKGRETRFIARAHIKRYSICLPRDEKLNGTMTWSSPDVKHNPKYTPVNVVGKYHWAVKLTDMKLKYDHGNPSAWPEKLQIHNLINKEACAILDSGTTLISPTTEMAAKLFAAIEIQNGLNCDDISKLPTLDFQLDGSNYSLPPEAYVARFDLVGDNTTKLFQNLFPKFLHVDKKRSCMLLLTQPMDIEQPFSCPAMILGMPFFRFYKTVFDWEAESVKKTTDKGMVYTAPHADCEEGYNSWDTNAMNYKYHKSPSKDGTKPQRKVMTIRLDKIKFPKPSSHYFQHGGL